MGFVSAACGVCVKGESAVDSIRCAAPSPQACFALHRAGSHYHRSTGQGQSFPVDNRAGLRPFAACVEAVSGVRAPDHRSRPCDSGAVAGGARTGGSSATSRIRPLRQRGHSRMSTPATRSMNASALSGFFFFSGSGASNCPSAARAFCSRFFRSRLARSP